MYTPFVHFKLIIKNLLKDAVLFGLDVLYVSYLHAVKQTML